MKRAEFLAVYLYELEQKLKAELPSTAEEYEFIRDTARIAWLDIRHISGAIDCYPPVIPSTRDTASEESKSC